MDRIPQKCADRVCVWSIYRQQLEFSLLLSKVLSLIGHCSRYESRTSDCIYLLNNPFNVAGSRSVGFEKWRLLSIFGSYRQMFHLFPEISCHLQSIASTTSWVSSWTASMDLPATYHWQGLSLSSSLHVVKLLHLLVLATRGISSSSQLSATRSLLTLSYRDTHARNLSNRLSRLMM